MKKLLDILFLLIVNCSLMVDNCYGQASIQWQWLYPGPYDRDDLGYDICASTEGNFFLTGVANGWNYFPNIYVKKIDPNGFVIWSMAIGGMNGSGYAFAVAPTLGGGCVTIGGKFLKFDANGNTIINKELKSGIELSDIKRTADNNYVACGRYNISNAVITKFDSLGNVLWENFYLTPYIKLLYSIDEGIDGGYVAVGRNQPLLDTIKLLIIKVDENGDSLWEKEYPNSTGLIINKLNESYIICGERSISKTDKLGNRFAYYVLDSTESNERVSDMKLLLPNRFVYSTNTFQSGNITSRILLSDSSNNIIRTKNFIFSNYVFLRGAEICANSDIIFMGEAALHDTSSKSLMYAFRTDTLFNIPPIGVIGITQIGSQIPHSFRLFQNYPDPFNPSTKIKFELPSGALTQLKIFDVLGREILILVNEFLSTGVYEVEFDASNLASGIYFYSLETKDFKEVKKMVLIK